jgi:hypothetical protein
LIKKRFEGFNIICQSWHVENAGRIVISSSLQKPTCMSVRRNDIKNDKGMK